MSWIILAAVASAVMVFLVLFKKYSAEKNSGVPMLRVWLKKFDVDPEKFSRECLDELMDLNAPLENIQRAQGLRPRREEAALGIAGNVAAVCFGENEASAEEIKQGLEKGYPHENLFWQVMAKHDPKRFALNNLETTQWLNRALRDEKHGRDPT